MTFALVILLLLAVAFVVAETVARRAVVTRLAGRLSEAAGYPIAVTLSRRPLVLQYFGRVPHVHARGAGTDGEWTDMRAERLTLGDRPTIGALRGTVEVDGIVLTGSADDLTYDKCGQTHVRGLDASAQISFARLSTVAAGSASSATVTSITGSAATGTLRVTLSTRVVIVPVPVVVTIAPTVHDGRIRFTVVRAEVFGAYVLSDFVQVFVDRFTQNVDALTDVLTVGDVEVSDAGIAVGVTAGDVVVSGGTGGWQVARASARSGEVEPAAPVVG
ncbi:hypothetical protein GII33_09165 [Gordonia pseudamarae]|jgi:hypothetical protein|uniref:DUF2993 domain-containing protein n=1 Tax=Gordonia pseudamarae TaxID=2831662 RepID=A0ABX6II81_9ACTN|nr:MULTISPECIES: hypothetical protein [Gordonia]MBD0021049.1 hypothetical protein [Gordonia sp. (in: high G+C Gram-positive bacteria)]QHN26113.1 hypothetical protein GII33_09165 [Gordonia pseudamarae]QHN35008.1 hypothetical protein GII31_08960 [Gordonia pseudamarae]